MTNFDVLDNQFLSLSENELSDIEGGLALPWLSLEQQYLGKLLQVEQHLQVLVWQLVIFQEEINMMKDLNSYREISNKELQEIKGGFGVGVGVGIALFMAGYTIGKDLRKKFGKSCQIKDTFLEG